MSYTTLTLTFIATLIFSVSSYAANIYEVSCAKCGYTKTLRTGRTKRSATSYSAYFCPDNRTLLSLSNSIVETKITKVKPHKQTFQLNHKMYRDYQCKSELIPFPLKNGHKPVCPICNKGHMNIKHTIRAC